MTKKKVSEELPKNETDAKLGKYVKGAVTGNWQDAVAEQALFAVNSNGAQSVIPSELLGEVFDYIQANSVLLNNSRILPMASNSLSVPYVEEAPTGMWKAEGEEGLETSLGLNNIKLHWRTAFILLSATREALLASGGLLENTIVSSLGDALINTIEQGFLYGQGDGSADAIEPRGILTLPDIHRINASDLVGGYVPFLRALRLIRQSNHAPTHIFVNATTMEYIDTLVDGNGNPLEMPQALQGMVWEVSEHLQDGQAIMYNPATVLVGIGTHLEMTVSITGDSNMKRNTQSNRLISYVDTNVPLPKQFALIENIPVSAQ